MKPGDGRGFRERAVKLANATASEPGSTSDRRPAAATARLAEIYSMGPFSPGLLNKKGKWRAELVMISFSRGQTGACSKSHREVLALHQVASETHDLHFLI